MCFILMMCNGVVLNNTARRLNPSEFRGFTLSDRVAPLIFINNADSQAAQMFTIAHELAHVWLGQSALGDEAMKAMEQSQTSQARIEAWCDAVAIETLAPISIMRKIYRHGSNLGLEIDRIAHYFKISGLAALRRIYDLGELSKTGFLQAYEQEGKKIKAPATTSGGNFYAAEGIKTGKRFAQALIQSTAEGRTLYRDALNLLGMHKVATFQEFARRMEVSI